MTIHKGPRYTIEIVGGRAVKTGGDKSLDAPYYPERDAGALAGEIDETTAWQILHDIAKQSAHMATPICPEHIFIDGDNFVLSPWSESTDSSYEAPEGYEKVWALAASVFYIFMGCKVFQGLGGKGQSANAPVPVLRRELPELSSLIASCLAFNPANRPSTKDIERISTLNFERCKKNKDEFPPLKSCSSFAIADETNNLWPDEMC